ncbi:hypothetical protein [Staphylococcus sp. HMSC076B11]|uniref:hypothetical protein n=1 Tax=Staphylococcus sp. HMSC076B11 TaxID=1715173 RepID=UPI0008A3476F|nr:hypothetical protein [Staphylococcus sp. HMSC076B11]OFM36388.1 hypothetical protein HMPREF2694_06015 [Staphylococcus sp. HMSC076B11]
MIYNKLISGVLAFTIILSGCSLNLNLDDKDKKSSNDPQQSKVTQNDKNSSNDQNESENNINNQNISKSSTAKENDQQPPINKKPISEYHALNVAKIYAKKYLNSGREQSEFYIDKNPTNNEAYFVNFKNGTVAGPALTQTIKVNKYRGEVIDSYTNATDEEMKQFNKAKEQKYGQNQEDNNQITNDNQEETNTKNQSSEDKEGTESNHNDDNVQEESSSSEDQQAQDKSSEND